MSKNFFVDTETTGLSDWYNGIWQIAGIIEVNDKIVERFDYKMNIHSTKRLEKQVTKLFGVTEEGLAKLPDPMDAYNQLCTVMGKYVNKFDKADKFYFIGYNSPFDNGFMRNWFKCNGDKYFGSWFHNPDLCVMRMAKEKCRKMKVEPPNFKLATVAEFFKVNTKEEKYHDAMFDIEITYDLFKEIQK